MRTIEQIIEDVVSGDHSGNPENIASGTNSGAVVSNGGIPVKKKKESPEIQEEPEQNKK